MGKIAASFLKQNKKPLNRRIVVPCRVLHHCDKEKCRMDAGLFYYKPNRKVP